MKHSRRLSGPLSGPLSGRLALAATLVGLLAALVLPAGAANAAAYRYWGYYQWDGKAWAFAQKGPGQITPADGSVEGYRFAIGDVDVTRFPRTTEVDFEAICGDTKAADGKKRVAVVLDFGRAADSADGATPPEPETRCASVPVAATGLEVLGAVAEVRTDKSLICGVDGYPATGCGEEVKTVSAEAKAADEPVDFASPGAESADDTADAATEADDETNIAPWLGLAIVVLVALAVGLTVLRRRRSA